MLVFLVLECYMDMFTLFMIPVVYLKGGIVSHLSKKKKSMAVFKKKKKKSFFCTHTLPVLGALVYSAITNKYMAFV